MGRVADWARPAPASGCAGMGLPWGSDGVAGMGLTGTRDRRPAPAVVFWREPWGHAPEGHI